jgi:hypothetical protein
MLTKNSVVDQMTAQLATRRTIARRQTAGYYRLAQHVLGTNVRALRPQIVAGLIAECTRTAA